MIAYTSVFPSVCRALLGIWWPGNEPRSCKEAAFTARYKKHNGIIKSQMLAVKHGCFFTSLLMTSPNNIFSGGEYKGEAVIIRTAGGWICPSEMLFRLWEDSKSWKFVQPQAFTTVTDMWLYVPVIIIIHAKEMMKLEGFIFSSKNISQR